MRINSDGPGIIPSEEYYTCRYSTLREPLGFPRGAEVLNDDDQAIHAWTTVNDEIIAVGRSHLIPAGNNGSQADYVGPDAPTCPDFTPLTSGDFRPAIQIRQMGTLPSHQRQGNAAKVLGDLEKSANKILGANTGFLQARAPAIPFYESQGWVIIDEEYEIPGIGPHRSMMKHLN